MEQSIFPGTNIRSGSYPGNIWLLRVIEARATSKELRQTHWDQHYALPFHGAKSLFRPQFLSLSADGSSVNYDKSVNNVNGGFAESFLISGRGLVLTERR